MDNKGKYICNGYIITSNGIIETKAFAKVSLIDDKEAFNSNRPYYCEVEYEDNDGIKWVKKIFANDPFSAFELGIDFIHSIISYSVINPKLKTEEPLEQPEGLYEIKGFMRDQDKITNIQARGKVKTDYAKKPTNSDLQYYCEVEYSDKRGEKFKKHLFANTPNSAFILGVKFVNSIIAYHNGFPENN